MGLGEKFDKLGGMTEDAGVGDSGQEASPDIFDLRFAIFERSAKRGSLTIESESCAGLHRYIVKS
jgi:hypothetical protein